jgi:hypothetical protein
LSIVMTSVPPPETSNFDTRALTGCAVGVGSTGGVGVVGGGVVGGGSSTASGMAGRVGGSGTSLGVSTAATSVPSLNSTRTR